MDQSQRGFTLIELVIVVSVLVILASLVLPGFNFWQRQSSLDSTAQEILSTLRLAQNKTLASEGDANFGVYFEPTKFTLFKGTTYYPDSPDNSVHNLSPTVLLSNVNLGGGNFVVFDRLSGTAANYGSLKIEAQSDSTKYKTVFVDSSGTVSLTSVTASDEARLKDSRHTEFTYSQNTKSASTLTLFFVTSNFTQNIVYQSYLNADKTEFSWEGTISTPLDNEKLKIHSHNLTDSATQFCIHRDRRYNTQALQISLDGQNLINYSITGTTTPGTSAWVSAPQNQ